VEGVQVFSPAVAAERWRGDAVFVVAIFHPLGANGMEARLAELRALGIQRVTTFLPLAWTLEKVLPHYGADLPSRILLHAEELKRVARLWGDETSRGVFRQQLAWRLRGDFSGTPEPSPEQYFPRDLVRPYEAEAFVDGGAFDGDTLRAAPWPLARVWAIEPDPVNIAKLKSHQRAGLVICETALGGESGSMRFNAAGTMASARASDGSVEVRISTLDGLLAKETPTFIKLDVEGDELAALEGGKNLLARTKPTVAVCLYHRPEDLWTIPLFLHKLLPDHRFFLRVHALDGFELVVYALPTNRWVQYA
jgi:FkbM family methyltransferase